MSNREKSFQVKWTQVQGEPQHVPYYKVLFYPTCAYPWWAYMHRVLPVTWPKFRQENKLLATSSLVWLAANKDWQAINQDDTTNPASGSYGPPTWRSS